MNSRESLPSLGSRSDISASGAHEVLAELPVSDPRPALWKDLKRVVVSRNSGRPR
jgi:hypothetical protein